MARIAILEFNGDWDILGFKVILEVREETGRLVLEKQGYLPPNPELFQHLQVHWNDKYRSLGSPARIKPQSIIRLGSIHQRIKACKTSADELRSHLKTWLNSDTFRPLDQRLREECQRDEEIRVLIRTSDRTFKKLPLHLWDFFESYSHAELAISPIELEPVSRNQNLPSKSPLKILAILGHQDGIDLQADLKLLQSLPHTEVTFLAEPKKSQINDQLWEQSWDIIFFAGHSETEGETGRIYINPQESITIEQLWYGLKKAVQRGLKLAIFNSCDGLGLAEKLDDLNIPQMIVMRELIPDSVAQAFLKYFLKAMTKGESLYCAVREARQRLQDEFEEQFPCASWLPIIYQHPAYFPEPWQYFPPKLFDWSKQVKIALLLFALGGFSWFIARPQLARILHNRWWDLYQSGQLSQAQNTLKSALFLTPNNRATHYTLGKLCESVQDLECTRKHFQFAAQEGLPAAYSDLARLAIIYDHNYGVAVNLSQLGLKLVEEGDDWIHYSLLKNLGWARWQQRRYGEALNSLETAKEVNPQRAGAYCLIAQVKDSQGEGLQALPFWESCLNLAQPDLPDDDSWIGLAQKRLETNQPLLSEDKE
ncbi:CHAT domain-containing tetratricopeptide repeat protein [Planktothrix agardhii]|jgi:tetratricopeptide (TPR) repeat protein|uniref:CHAT domain-containing tetratricopeptide repeat protein n=1 Tax=Planktothrix agardhii TaxID=1160 RepID=UPI0028A7613B|nr:CHAT domain-containing protein [Planktothrix agardhii]